MRKRKSYRRPDRDHCPVCDAVYVGDVRRARRSRRTGRWKVYSAGRVQRRIKVKIESGDWELLNSMSEPTRNDIYVCAHPYHDPKQISWANPALYTRLAEDLPHEGWPIQRDPEKVADRSAEKAKEHRKRQDKVRR